jgi:hypothetical protein
MGSRCHLQGLRWRNENWLLMVLNIYNTMDSCPITIIYTKSTAILVSTLHSIDSCQV